MKKITSLLLVVVLLFATFAVCMVPASAAGNTLSTATAISVGKAYSGTITDTNRSDFYKFSLSTSGRLRIKLTAYIYKTSYHLYDSKGNCVWEWNYQYWNGVSEQYNMDTNIDLTSGTYYFCIEQRDGFGKYNFKLSFASSNESFKETTGGVNNTMAKASKISTDKSYKGQLASNDDKDFYKFVLSQSGSITLKLTAYIYETHYYIYDVNGNCIWNLKWQCWNTVSEQYDLNTAIDLTSGTYYFCVERCNGTGNYNFKLYYKNANESIKETSGGINNALANASAISLNTKYYGQIAQNDDKDFYKFILPSSGEITFSVNAYIYKTNYYIYDANGNVEWEADYQYWNDTSKKYTATHKVTLTKGTHYLCVEKNDGTGIYNFAISYKIPVSKISSLKAATSTSAIALTWAKASGVSGYQVYRYNPSTKKYVRLANVTTNSYKISKLPSGTAYKFAVRAYKKVSGSYYYGSFSFITTATRPGTPTLKATPGSKKVTLSWNKQTGATGYAVYMATSQNGKYSRIATLKGSTKVSVTKTGLTKGRTYYFKVIAYKTVGSTNLYGAYSAVKAAKVK